MKAKIHQVPIAQTHRAPATLDIVWDEEDRCFAFVAAERGVIHKRTMLKIEADHAASIARFIMECLNSRPTTRAYPILPAEKKK